MNEMDQLARLRDIVPLEVTPRAEQLFRAGLQEEHHAERHPVPRRRTQLGRVRPTWRLGVVVSAAAALVAGIVVAVLPSPSAPVVLTPAKLLADRASAAALTQPAVSPGQWVYKVIENTIPASRRFPARTYTSAGWVTADGGVSYGNLYEGVAPGDPIPSYSELGSLPASPAALDAYLAHLVYPDSSPAPDIRGMAAFSDIEDMLTNYVLPPALEAEAYQALAAIPGIQVDRHVTAIDGQAGVAFVLPPTPQSEKQEIILNASNYSFLGWVSFGTGNSVLLEQAVVRMVIVGAPGSTQPSLTPPTAAELLAEQADRAVTYIDPRTTPQLLTEPGTWVLRELATSSGNQTVWATADDSEQASYVKGKLQVCSRSEACAQSTQWLMPVGPSYTQVANAANGEPPVSEPLPDSPTQLIAALNSYRTGCADVASDCNAVNVMVNMIAGYGILGDPSGDWFLMLADIPGVTVKRVTDVTGQAGLAFRYPFTDGITEILLNASTHQFAGFVRGGVETVITKEVTVSRPGSYTPVRIRPHRP